MNHYAHINTSERLQRIMLVLKDGKPHTTLEIQNKARVCAVGAAMQEIKAGGYRVECSRRKDRAFEYVLKGPEGVPVAAAYALAMAVKTATE